MWVELGLKKEFDSCTPSRSSPLTSLSLLLLLSCFPLFLLLLLRRCLCSCLCPSLTPSLLFTIGAPTYAAERLSCWTAASFMDWFLSVYLQCAPTQRVSFTSLSLASWPAEGGERGTRHCANIMTCLGSYSLSQAWHVFCLWTMTIWPASLCCSSAQLVLHWRAT